MVLPGLAGTPGRRTAGCWKARTRPAGSRSRWSPQDATPEPDADRAARSCNAIVALAAIGGSTNAVVHLLAIAGRLGVDADPGRLRPRSARDVPLLVDLQPAGRFLMEDFYRAGGLLAVLREVRDLLDPDGAHRHRAGRWSTTSTTRRSGTAR